MDIILLERIERLGQIGDVVSVRPGYARNYLLPKQKALRATKENLAAFEQRRAQIEADNIKRRDEAEAVAKKLEGFGIVVIRQAGESGQLYGSVNARDIVSGVTEGGVTIERHQVALDQVIKTLGIHKVALQLHPEVKVNIIVNVARSQEEAERQAETGKFVSQQDLEEAEEAIQADIDALIADSDEEEQEETESDSETTEEEPSPEGESSPEEESTKG